MGGDSADYLNICILNGLKSLENVELFDYPKSEVLYKKNRAAMQQQIRGNGFTLFFLKEETATNRFHLLLKELMEDFFDLVIIGDIHNSFGYFVQALPHLRKEKTIILDGSDSPSIYPYSGKYWRELYYWFLPRAHNKFPYYKRELTPETLYYRWWKLVPKSVCKRLAFPSKLFPISFAIPDEKIVGSLPMKTKDFPVHIVDEEVCAHIPGSSTRYAFKDEAEYYGDIQTSRFGITTKRSGWDCLRHYEIAANGTVICFKDLDKKPKRCAPHGLVDMVNCISYNSYEELMAKISAIDQATYSQLQKASWQWAKDYSTKQLAKQLIEKHLNKA